MPKKLFFIIIVIVLVGSFFGSVFSAKFAGANVLDDFLGFLKKPVAPKSFLPSLNPVESPQVLYKPAADYESAVVKAVETASPSVVSIVISKDLPVIEQCPFSPFSDLPPEFRDFFGDGFNLSQPCQKGTKRQEIGGGSGFIISSDGLVITNKHVVADTKADYTVLTNEGEKYEAKVLARDIAQDLAILKINLTNGGLPVSTLGDSDKIRLGQTAIAIGNALGEFRNTVSVGVISGLARNITASGKGISTEVIQGVIQTDTAINPGNSGGPLLNLRGEVIGINTAIASGAQNIGFAIPINQAKRAIKSVKETGAIKVPYIGVRYLMLSEEISKSQKLPVAYGALVRGTTDGPAVMPNSPAEKAGILAEDIILEVNGEKLENNKTLSSVIQKYNIGDTLNMKIRRGDKTLDVSLTLAERPEL